MQFPSRYAALAAAVFLTLNSLPTRSHAQQCDLALPTKLEGDISLPFGCIYEKSIRITTSGTTLNCNGAIFDGKQRLRVGLIVESLGKPLSNIEVRNCTFQNYLSGGVRVGWGADDKVKGSNHAENYARTPTRVRLNRLQVKDSGRVGIYFDDYVTESELSDSTISNSGNVGLYLDHSSRNNRIVGNRFIRNGTAAGGREAIAVDSSAGNVIENNVFENNTKGGIFIYKNCSENIRPENSAVRWQHSTDNRISNNTFVGEKIGVWIASRQSRNLQSWKCSDKPMDLAGKFYEDFADENIVESNKFCHTEVAIRVESDRNKILRNTFGAEVQQRIDIPRTMREKFLGRPQTGNIVSNNIISNCPIGR